MATVKKNAGKTPAMKQKELPSEMYTVSGTSVRTKKDRQKALAEFEAIVDDNIAASYKAWGSHAVNYSEVDTQTQIRKLKSCNDAYTMSMVMSCAGPLGSGVTPGSLLQVWTSYRLISSLNPSMDMDVSRMLSNLTSEVRPIYDNIKKSNPAIAFALKPLVKELDKYGASMAGSKMQSAIHQNMQDDSLDSMVMTPKQVAALKVSFMEQYYRDLRTGTENQNTYTEKYNTAVEHLKNIAKNSGFDMSVVAAEERHIVGIKMMHNKEYANVFNETYGLYGVSPEMEGGKFSDKFVTRDGHEYNLNGSGTGAFTVRVPMNSSDTVMAEHVRMITTNADQLVAMNMWLDSDSCTLSRGDVAKVRKALGDCKDAYEGHLIKMMQDDGVESAGDLIQSFETQYEQMQGVTTAGAYPAFQMELDRIVYKDILERTHAVEPDPNGEKLESALQKLLSFDKKDASIPELGAILQYEQERCEAHGTTSARSIRTIMDDMRMNYLESLSPEDMTELLMHAGNNLQQSLREPNRRSYYRDGYTYDPEVDFGQAIADEMFGDHDVEEQTKTPEGAPAPAEKSESTPKTGPRKTAGHTRRVKRVPSRPVSREMPIMHGIDVEGPTDEEMDFDPMV